MSEFYLPTAVQGLGTQPLKTQESLEQASLGLRTRLPLSSVPLPDCRVALSISHHIFHLQGSLFCFVSFPGSLLSSYLSLQSAKVTDMCHRASLICLSLEPKYF